MIEHEQMIAVLVEPVEIAAAASGFELGPSTKDFIEDAVAQCLRGVDVGLTFGEPNL